MDVKLIDKARSMIREAAKAALSAHTQVLAALRMAVEGGIAAPTAEKTGEKRKRELIDWAQEAVKVPAQYDSIRVYVSMGAAVALVPDAVGVVETGKGEKASKREVSADKIKTAEELREVAKVANAALGIKARGTRTKAPDADTDAAAKLKEAQAKIAKMEKEKAEAPPLVPTLVATCAAVRAILTSGTPTERAELAKAIADAGFTLKAAQVRKPATKPAKASEPKPRNAKARKPGRRVEYGEHATR